MFARRVARNARALRPSFRSRKALSEKPAPGPELIRIRDDQLLVLDEFHGEPDFLHQEKAGFGGPSAVTDRSIAVPSFLEVENEPVFFGTTSRC